MINHICVLDRAGGEAEGEGRRGGPQDGGAQGQGQEGARGLVSNNILENQLFASCVVDPHHIYGDPDANPDSTYHTDVDPNADPNADPESSYHPDVDQDADPDSDFYFMWIGIQILASK